MIYNFLTPRFRFLFDLLHGEELEMIILRDQESIRFFTDFKSSNSFLVVLRKHIYVVTDPRYAGDLWATDHRLVRKIVRDPLALVLQQLERLRGAYGYDSSFPPVTKEKIHRINPLGHDLTSRIENFISVADKETIKRFSKAAAVTEKIEKQLPRLMKAGIKEYKLRAEISYLIHSAGCEEAFTPIVSFGENTARIHTEPTNKKLKAEMPVLIDFGVKYEGVSTDITRSFWFGETPVADYQNVRKAVKKALKVAESEIANSVECSKPGVSALNTLTALHPEPSECLPHALGHGLGYKVHQFPRISGNSEHVFQTGQIITLEPGIYIPDKFGVRIEHDYLVTEKGVTKLI